MVCPPVPGTAGGHRAPGPPGRRLPGRPGPPGRRLTGRPDRPGPPGATGHRGRRGAVFLGDRDRRGAALPGDRTDRDRRGPPGTGAAGAVGAVGAPPTWAADAVGVNGDERAPPVGALCPPSPRLRPGDPQPCGTIAHIGTYPRREAAAKRAGRPARHGGAAASPPGPGGPAPGRVSGRGGVGDRKAPAHRSRQARRSRRLPTGPRGPSPRQGFGKGRGGGQKRPQPRRPL